MSQSIRIPRGVWMVVWLVAAVVVGGWIGPLEQFTAEAHVMDVEPVAGPTIALATASPIVIPTAVPTPIALPMPGCAIGDQVTLPGPDGDWVLAVVDTELRLPDGFAPPDLVATSRAGMAGGGKIRAIALADLREMAVSAKADGIPLRVHSAYRSEARQDEVFDEWAAAVGRRKALRVSARAGHSEHQLGTTIDFARGAAAPWTEKFGKTPTGRWLASHAPDFGFVMSYPEGGRSATCYDAEPWHFRWIGREHAASFVASGMTLREWLWLER
jgi:D-alanyl-D-alanine carboxypeptidase